MSTFGRALFLISAYNVKIWMGIISDLYILCQDLDGHCFGSLLIMPRSGWALFLTSTYYVKIWMGTISDPTYYAKIWMGTISDLYL